MGSCVKFVPKPIKLPNNANTISPTVLNCAALQIPQLIAHFPVAEPETAPVLHRGKLKLHRRLVEVIWLCVISASGSLLYYRASFPPCRAPFRVSPAFPLFLLPCSFYTPSRPSIPLCSLHFLSLKHLQYPRIRTAVLSRSFCLLSLAK